MAEWLILRLPRAADVPATWLAVDAHGLAASGPQSGTLAEAAIAARARRVCAVLNGGDVLLTEVDVPVKGGARVAQIVPYALEEQLVGDIEQQHFAVGKRNALSGRTAVAVVARRVMDDTLSQLRTAGIEPDVLCSESSLLPAIPGSVVALLEAEQLTVVPPSEQAISVSVPADDLAAALAIALPEVPIDSMHVLLHVGPLDWQRRASEVEALRSRVASLKPQVLRAGVLPWLAPQAIAGQAINLLQNDYAARRSATGDWRRWRLAAALLCALLLLHTGGKAYQLWQLRGAERQLDAELATLGAQLLPGTTVGPAQLRNRVQARLASGAAPAQNELLQTLQSLAAAFSASPGTVLQALSYREGVTDLKLRAADAQSLERINQALRGTGVAAEVLAGAAAANGYEGRIQLKSGERR